MFEYVDKTNSPESPYRTKTEAIEELEKKRGRIPITVLEVLLEAVRTIYGDRETLTDAEFEQSMSEYDDTKYCDAVEAVYGERSEHKKYRPDKRKTSLKVAQENARDIGYALHLTDGQIDDLVSDIATIYGDDTELSKAEYERRLDAMEAEVRKREGLS